jgi:hypothetical protein
MGKQKGWRKMEKKSIHPLVQTATTKTTKIPELTVTERASTQDSDTLMMSDTLTSVKIILISSLY